MNSEALFAITANVGGKVRSYNLKIKDRAGKTDEEIIEILKRDSGLISIHKLWTVETSSALPEEEKLRMLKEAKAVIVERGGAMAHLVTVLRPQGVLIVREGGAMKKYEDGTHLSISGGKIRVHER